MQTLAHVGADAAGFIYGGPVGLGAAEGGYQGYRNGGSIGDILKGAVIGGGTAYAGGQLLGGLGSAFPETSAALKGGLSNLYDSTGLSTVGNNISSGLSSLSDSTGLTDLGNSISGGLSDFSHASGLSDIGSGISNGFSSLSNSIGLGSSGGTTADGLQVGQLYDTPLAQSAATGTTPSTLTGYLPGSGGAIAGGGSTGGFFSPPSTGTFGVSPLADNFSSLGTSFSPTDTLGGVADAYSPILDNSGTGALSGNAGTFNVAAAPNPFGVSPLDTSLGYPTAAAPASSTTSGLAKMFSPSNLANGALKGGLQYLMQNNNAGGSGAMQGAANAAAAGYQPFMKTGQQATGTLADLYGLNGAGAAQAATQNWQNTPGYQFARDQGIRGLDASAASRGMALSGNQQQAIQQYGTGLADQYYQQYLANLQGQQRPGLAGTEGYGNNVQNAAEAYNAQKGRQASSYNTMLSGLANFL